MITTKGYRFLSHLNLNEKEISDIVTKFDNLTNIFKARIEDFGDLFGARSENIVREIENLREQILSGKVMT
jgi:DNA integrity scanning protein DisA with diadenylate cyclase activity